MMPGKVRLFLRRRPFVLKVVLLTLLSGLLVGYLTDRYTHDVVETIFRNHLGNMLEQQSQEDRLRFDHYRKNFQQVARLTVEHRPFLAYLEKRNWSGPAGAKPSINNGLPGWLLNRQALGNLAVPRYVMLLDEKAKVREIFSKNDPLLLPNVLSAPSGLLIEKARGQAQISSTEYGPYVITAEDVFVGSARKATLLVASPIDDEFLMATQKDMPHRLIGLVDAEANTLISSNDNALLPRNISLEELERDYVITGRDYHDYGGAEMAIRLSSFVPRKEIVAMGRNFIDNDRKQRLIATAIYFCVFILITLWITRRIVKLTREVDRFSRQALGGKNPPLPPGDQLDILSERFQILTEEVVSSQRLIREKAESEAARQIDLETKSRQLVILELIMESLGFGVLMRKGGEYQAVNSKMQYYLESCGHIEEFVVEPRESLTRQLIDKEGNRLVFELTGLDLFDDSRVILVSDVSEKIAMAEEKERLQEDLNQAMKMESIGRLAGGIAHDFNNILTAVLGYSQLGIIKSGKNDPLKANFENIFEASKRASDITQQLLYFSRKQKIKPQIIDLKSILEGLRKMFGRLIGENIQVDVFCEEGLWKTRADRIQIEQVLMNLALNARDAMPGGGRLVFELANVEIRGTAPKKNHGIDPGQYVRLVVKDNGTGISREDMEHIFEPFFSTKDFGKGTGLGLATVYGIVKQNRGAIFVRSEIGKGSTFEIFLPACEEDNEKSREPVVRNDLATGKETILLVEDEPLVRKLIKGVLSSLGYEIHEADAAAEAERLFDLSQDQIDLLFTDVIMPGITGVALAARLSARKPGLKVLFMTGYQDNNIINDLGLGSDANLLYKPLTPISISQKVREVLDK